MFVDYYELLNVAENASAAEIKEAFRKQAIKWHPDKNPGIDTTLQMQRINEAYLILKDLEARRKFDTEYQYFKGFRKEQRENNRNAGTNSQSAKSSSSAKKENDYEYANYSFNDDILNNWVNNARNQSISLAKQTIKDFKGMVSVGIKEGVKASGQALIVQILLSLIVLILFGLSKSCSS